MNNKLTNREYTICKQGFSRCHRKVLIVVLSLLVVGSLALWCIVVRVDSNQALIRQRSAVVFKGERLNIQEMKWQGDFLEIKLLHVVPELGTVPLVGACPEVYLSCLFFDADGTLLSQQDPVLHSPPTAFVCGRIDREEVTVLARVPSRAEWLQFNIKAGFGKRDLYRFPLQVNTFYQHSRIG